MNQAETKKAVSDLIAEQRRQIIGRLEELLKEARSGNLTSIMLQCRFSNGKIETIHHGMIVTDHVLLHLGLLDLSRDQLIAAVKQSQLGARPSGGSA